MLKLGKMALNKCVHSHWQGLDVGVKKSGKLIYLSSSCLGLLLAWIDLKKVYLGFKQIS